MNKRETQMMEAAKERLEKARKAYEAAQHCDDPEQHLREMAGAESELRLAQKDWAVWEVKEAQAKQLAVATPTPSTAVVEMMDRSVAASRKAEVLQIVAATAKQIQGRPYLQVEGWQSIALAHGCVASAGDVERVEGAYPGFRAIGKVIAVETGVVVATAEGFVGDDEQMWRKRPAFARRAMAQTRAISRACRSAFAHVVVLINSQHQTRYATTPAEEMDGVVSGEVETESEWAAEIDATCKQYGADPAKVWDWLGAQSYDRFNVTEKVADKIVERLRKKQADKEAAA